MSAEIDLVYCDNLDTVTVAAFSSLRVRESFHNGPLLAAAYTSATGVDLRIRYIPVSTTLPLISFLRRLCRFLSGHSRVYFGAMEQQLLDLAGRRSPRAPRHATSRPLELRELDDRVT